MPWTTQELQRIVAADDLHIAPLREDGVTHGTPTWIWCVAVDGPVDGLLDDRIDEAYRQKYRTSRYLAPMVGPRAGAATVRIDPAAQTLDTEIQSRGE